MAYTAADYNTMLYAYMKTPHGKKLLKEAGASHLVPDRADMEAMALELLAEIRSAYKTVVGRGHVLDFGNVRITMPRRTNPDAQVLRVDIPNIALARLSLMNVKRGKIVYTGERYRKDNASFYHGLPRGYGVYDILGLFTQGYATENRARGYPANAIPHIADGRVTWTHHPIDATSIRSPSTFVSDAVARFQKRHPDVRVLYPAAWGGQL